MENKTLVVITSALFVGAKGELLTAPSHRRVIRLQKSITALAAIGFKHFVLLDNTIPPTFNLNTLPIIVATLTPSSINLPANEFQLNGPSRLEAVLLGQAIADIQQRLLGFKFVLKISAGYEVKNLERILAKATAGVVFRMGNPFRTKIKFCLTSFYILPVQHFINLAGYFNAKLDDMSNLKPLEYHLYTYVQQVEHQLVAMPYPQFEADFLSSGRSSNDLNYRLKEQIFRLLAKFGLYAYGIK